VVVSMALDGNAFIYTMRNDKGAIQALYALDPLAVTIKDLPMGETKFSYGGEEYDRSQILHIPLFTMPGRTRGLSPIDAAREAIGLGLTAEEFGARFYQQGTAMSGVIEHPLTPKPDEAKMLREMFRKTHAGTKNSHAVGVLTGGATFKPITLAPDKAQFLETRRFQNHQIALLYHIPIYMIDPTVTSSWGSGIEEQNKGLIDYALMPYIVRIEQAVSTFLIGGNRHIKFNLDARLRPKTKERFDAYMIAVNNGWMNLDEVRALEDMEPIPGGLGQDFYRPLNNMYALGQPLPQPSAANPVDGDVNEDGVQDSEQGTIPKDKGAKRSEEIHVHVEPTINVAAPEVRINPAIEVKQPSVTVAPARSRRVERDENGEITRIIEE
jgi:HK97 family phage portal protein